jgi:hypothetical protein
MALYIIVHVVLLVFSEHYAKEVTNIWPQFQKKSTENVDGSTLERGPLETMSRKPDVTQRRALQDGLPRMCKQQNWVRM